MMADTGAPVSACSSCMSAHCSSVMVMVVRVVIALILPSVATLPCPGGCVPGGRRRRLCEILVHGGTDDGAHSGMPLERLLPQLLVGVVIEVDVRLHAHDTSVHDGC